MTARCPKCGYALIRGLLCPICDGRKPTRFSAVSRGPSDGRTA